MDADAALNRISRVTFDSVRSLLGMAGRGQPPELSCDAVEQLAAAYGLGAVEADTDDAVSAHLVSCRDAHGRARELIASAALVPLALAPERPSAVLRSRLLSTIATVPRAGPAQPEPAGRDASRRRATAPIPEARRSWWRSPPLSAATALAAGVALTAAIGGAWAANLSTQVAADDDALRAVTAADALHPVAGTAGMGWLIESDGQLRFLVAELASLPDGQVYALWLRDPSGAPTPVGTMTDVDDFALVPLEHAVAGASSFVVTIEHGRVASPTSEPVLVAALDT